MLTWKPVEGASSYQVFRDGTAQGTIETTFLPTKPLITSHELQVAAQVSDATASFLSEPVMVGDPPIIFPAVPSESNTDSGSFVTLEQSGATTLSVSVKVPRGGRYALTFRYANGSGPVNTGSRYAIRTLLIDGDQVGPIVLPQRGANAWDLWGWSNIQIVSLGMGKHTIDLRFLPADRNMDGAVNTVRIQVVQLELVN